MRGDRTGHEPTKLVLSGIVLSTHQGSLYKPIFLIQTVKYQLKGFLLSIDRFSKDKICSLSNRRNRTILTYITTLQ